MPKPAKTIIDHISDGKASITFGSQLKKRYPVQVVESSPCMLACPAGVNVKSYVSLIAAGKFHEALKAVRERNPLPGICGRVCTHPCEAFCNRNEIDTPVAICWLKRFVADYELEHPMPKPEVTAGRRKEKVAVIGAGPAGLTAAHDLALRGYGATIFEALPEPGGMLIAGIPSYRMPRDILNVEIDYIRDLGVKIKTDAQVKGKTAYQKLLKQYDAVFIAIGAHIGKKLNIPGENDYKGFLDAVTFLKQTNFEKPKKPGDKVIVIGGGNSAIDAARTAIRLGSEVNIVYRRTRKEMPANEAEIDEAEKEGIKIHYLASPVKIVGENGKVTEMECTKMKLGKPDDSGRRRPIPIKDSEFTIEADVIIPAISQEPDLSFLPKDHGLDISRWNSFIADEQSLATNIPGVFAGGDAVTGPNTVIDAIAQGHIAADSIDKYINGEQLTKKDIRIISPEAEIKIELATHPNIKRADMPMRAIPKRKNSFDEVEFGFDEATAIAEAQRCLRCGPCDECNTCVSECDKGLAVFGSIHGQNDIVFRLPPNFPIQESRNGKLSAFLEGKSGKAIELDLHSYVPFVKENLCRGCGDCATVCEYDACELIPKGDDIFVSQIDMDLCRGCGTCVAFCPTSAIQPGRFTADWLTYKLQEIDPDKSNVVVFSCNWNGADFNKSNYTKTKNGKTNLIFIQTMCTGRIEMSFIFNALEKGADKVLIAGCSTDECHYEFGAKKFVETFEKTKQLAYMLGIGDDKISFVQISGKNTGKFVEAVNKFANRSC